MVYSRFQHTSLCWGSLVRGLIYVGVLSSDLFSGNRAVSTPPELWPAPIHISPGGCVLLAVEGCEGGVLKEHV